jgi:hypothetical protein
MKKQFTTAILFLLLTANAAYAQFTTNDVVFWVGEGDSEAVLVIDFRDGTTDPSFAWGYRFNAADEETFGDMMLAIEAAEPTLTLGTAYGGTFLEDVVYNHHTQLAGEPDWWSSWSGPSLSGLESNMGLAEELVNGGWYGVSYGFSPESVQPTVTYAAYSSLWFTDAELTYSIGEGTDSAVIVIDFVGTDEVSFAWKINFDGNITPQAALQLIADNDADFEVTFDGENTTITYGTLVANFWTAYNGTNLSDWVVGDFTTEIEDNQWFGISAGDDLRRPFLPIPAPENSASTDNFSTITLSVYPNPATEFFTITSDNTITNINIFNLSGQKVASQTANNTSETIFTNQLTSGLYLVEIATEKGTTTQKVVVK